MGAQITPDAFIVHHQKYGNHMSQKLTYTRISDCYYFNLYIPISDIDHPWGEHRMLRKAYLKQLCPVAYEIMLMGSMLEQHLYAINDYAAELVDQVVHRVAERSPRLKLIDNDKSIKVVKNAAYHTSDNFPISTPKTTTNTIRKSNRRQPRIYCEFS